MIYFVQGLLFTSTVGFANGQTSPDQLFEPFNVLNEAMRGHSMLRFQGLALRCGILLSLFSTGCCCVQSSPCGTGCGPGAWVANQACSNGCGEFYVDEWYNHPPQCDPCNTCGDYVGGCGHEGCGCGEPACVPLLHRLNCFWGMRYTAPSCDSGCSSCDSGMMAHDGHVVSSGGSGCASCAAGASQHFSSEGGEVIYDGPVRHSAPSQMAPSQTAPSKMSPTPAQPKSATPPAASPMPEAGTTTRSTSPALRKRSNIQQASAQQAVRKR